jgi:CBS domain-containing protein
MFLCHLADGSCPFQHPRELADGTPVIGCTDPHCVPTDWQMVELESVTAAIRDVMTTEVVNVGPDTPVPELARVMLDRGVHRLLVLDPDRRPVGVVAVNDLLQVFAHPELAAAGVVG